MDSEDDGPADHPMFRPGQIVRWISDPDGLFWRVNHSSNVGGRGRTYEIRPIDGREIKSNSDHVYPGGAPITHTDYISVFEFQLRELDKKDQAELTLLKVTDDV